MWIFRVPALTLLLVVQIVRVADAQPAQRDWGARNIRLVADDAQASATIIGGGREWSEGGPVDRSFSSSTESVAADRIHGEAASSEMLRLAKLEPGSWVGSEFSALLVLGTSLVPIAIVMFRHVRRHGRRRRWS